MVATPTGHAGGNVLSPVGVVSKRGAELAPTQPQRVKERTALA